MSMKRFVIKRQVTIEFVPLDEHMESQRCIADDSTDPYVVLRRKTKHLAELLDCTEAEAERIILEKI